ncbi:MAG: T6SS effector phospholipase Tle3 domain-containing protein [Telluria sp.]
MNTKGLYKLLPFSVGTADGMHLPAKDHQKLANLRHNLPGAVILVHGVNDVGTAYDAVESGICEGLTRRLCGDIRPASYSVPKSENRDKLEDDPDDVFYKRKTTTDTHSPIIPFYWGYREVAESAIDWKHTVHGQTVDRFGNRLDRDFSKGGGPFSNATNSIPEMWNRGKGDAFTILDRAAHDATHPILKSPGRMYMILAAKRLAALISMIRDYDIDDTVSIVAHSQGCLISLLAQAMLIDMGKCEGTPCYRPADTLVLCNPPYSLIEEVPFPVSVTEDYSGEDQQMAGRYHHVTGGQTMHARVQTLANIVRAVFERRQIHPPLEELKDAKKHCGVVGAKWEPGRDRDNRGKVYLYFSPEDMTVALANVQGIGWQGIPDYQLGSAYPPGQEHDVTKRFNMLRRPLDDLGPSFFQRIFTLKRRPDPNCSSLTHVGESSQDFELRLPGEDDHAHTAESDSVSSNWFVRAHLPRNSDAPPELPVEAKARYGYRKINGEALPQPIIPSMGEGAMPDEKHRYGASEMVDLLDAPTAVTSRYGLNEAWILIQDPEPHRELQAHPRLRDSPAPEVYKGKVCELDEALLPALQDAVNKNKKPGTKFYVRKAYVCVGDSSLPKLGRPLELLVRRSETGDEARLRWQHAQVPRSFHSAIYGGRRNHSYVTAYDIAIGRGSAVTHPQFYQYLCAVADWRMKEQRDPSNPRPSINLWTSFLTQFSSYWADERPWRKALIQGNMSYYSNGKLPDGLPLPPGEVPTAVVVQSMAPQKADAHSTRAPTLQ